MSEPAGGRRVSHGLLLAKTFSSDVVNSSRQDRNGSFSYFRELEIWASQVNAAM